MYVYYIINVRIKEKASIYNISSMFNKYLIIYCLFMHMWC